jgi:hypothetical protein
MNDLETPRIRRFRPKASAISALNRIDYWQTDEDGILWVHMMGKPTIRSQHCIEELEADPTVIEVPVDIKPGD